MTENPEEFQINMPDELKAEVMQHLISASSRREKKFRTNEVLLRLAEIAFIYSGVSVAYTDTADRNALSLIVFASIIGALATHASANNYQMMKENEKIQQEAMGKWKNHL